MTWLRPILGALLLLAGVAQAASAQTTADAKADGKAFGGSVIDRAKGAATTAPDASRVPGFNPAATQSLEDLADHPDRIEGAARSAATGNTAIRTIEDSMDNRARFSPQEIKRILARSGEISETPLDYRSEEHTSELQSLMRISYAVFCLKQKQTAKSNTLTT